MARVKAAKVRRYKLSTIQPGTKFWWGSRIMVMRQNNDKGLMAEEFNCPPDEVNAICFGSTSRDNATVTLA